MPSALPRVGISAVLSLNILPISGAYVRRTKALWNRLPFGDLTVLIHAPHLKPNAKGVATGGIKCGAGSFFPTAVYKKGYIKEEKEA